MNPFIRRYPTPAASRRRTLRRAAAALCLYASQAAAQSLPSDPCAAAEGGALLLSDASGQCAPAPILDTDVTITVTGIIARVRVAQRFYNPGDGWVEGIYVFPLPDGAVVDHLRMFVGDRLIEGQIRERDSARADYAAAKRAGIKASLVEQQRPNVFTTSVANIGPEETVEILLELQDVVRYDNGEFRLRFPTVVAPRYLDGGGASAAAADGTTQPEGADPLELLDQAAPRATQPVNFFTMDVEIDAGFPLRALYSPSHHIETDHRDGDIRLVHLRDSLDPSDRDFVLAWAPHLGDEPQAALFSEEIDGDTYALMMIVPPAVAPRSGHGGREVVLVVDTSGSMGGASIDQAKLALLLALDQLQPGDWFNVIEFNTDARSLFPSSVAAQSTNLDSARAFVDSLRADGGTNIAAALELALAKTTAASDLRQIIFVTDGAVGNEAELFSYIEEHLGDSRLFTIGIGSAPNAHFMRKAADFGRGSFTFIGKPQDVSAAMDTLFAKIERPALTDLLVDWGGENGADADVWPARIPDLYSGEPLIAAARLNFRPRSVEVHGRLESETWSMSLDHERPGTVLEEESGIGKLWARRKVEGLMDGLALGDDRDKVRAAVTTLGLEHHLVTPFTSLIAVDVAPTAPPGEAPARLVTLNRPAGSPGLLPSTATPSPQHIFAALALLLVGLALRPRDDESAEER